MSLIRPRGNVGREPLRWTIERASREFKVAPGTLRAALSQASVAAGEDGCFTTEGICEGLFGVMHQEKLKTQKEIRKRIMLSNQITQGEVLNKAALAKGLAMIMDAVMSRIMASHLDRLAKEDILKDLASWPMVLDDVAHAQTRLPRGNGACNGDDGSED